MTPDRKHRWVFLWGGSMVWLVFASCGSGDDAPGPTWKCVVASDGCTCSQLRPGFMHKPGVMWVDACPAAQCCLLNTTGDESTMAICGCVTIADTCESRPETKVVPKCPPP